MPCRGPSELPGPEGSTLKIVWSELDQKLKATALEILGPAGMVNEGDPLAVDAKVATHLGGSSLEVDALWLTLDGP